MRICHVRLYKGVVWGAFDRQFADLRDAGRRSLRTLGGFSIPQKLDASKPC